MPTSQPDRIIWPGCKAAFKYRPELAGKRVKCKCGTIINVPTANPPVKVPVVSATRTPKPPPQDEEPLRPAPLPPEKAPAADDIYDVQEPTEPVMPKPIKAPQLAYVTPTKSAASAPSAQEGDLPSPYRGRAKRQHDEEEKKGVIRLAILCGALAVVIGGAILGIRMLGASKGPPTPLLGEDGEVQQMMDDQPYKEVHAWFAQDHDRIMGPWNESQALNHADTWQKEGAKQVLAFGSRMSLVAVIELPNDPALRKPIFDWQADWHRQHDDKVIEDVGQKYLIIRLGV